MLVSEECLISKVHVKNTLPNCYENVYTLHILDEELWCEFQEKLCITWPLPRIYNFIMLRFALRHITQTNLSCFHSNLKLKFAHTTNGNLLYPGHLTHNCKRCNGKLILKVWLQPRHRVDTIASNYSINFVAKLLVAAGHMILQRVLNCLLLV